MGEKAKLMLVTKSNEYDEYDEYPEYDAYAEYAEYDEYEESTRCTPMGECSSRAYADPSLERASNEGEDEHHHRPSRKTGEGSMCSSSSSSN
jgi:hypothetical protein